MIQLLAKINKKEMTDQESALKGSKITVVLSKLSSLSVICLCYTLTNCVHPVLVCERGKLDLLLKFADFED